MAKRKRTLVERAYRANVLSDGVLTRIESLEGTNLTPQNTDFEQLKSLAGPEKKRTTPTRMTANSPPNLKAQATLYRASPVSE